MRVAIVTGAASGIGRATVELLVKQDVAVVAVDRDAAGLDWIDDAALTGGVGTDRVGAGRVERVVGDVTDEAVDVEMARVAIERFGRLDAAVFNAGVSMGGGLTELGMDDFDRAMAVNVRAVALGMRAVTPHVRASDAGRIVVTASTSGIGADPGMWAYNTAKGAVINLVRAAAVELGPSGTTVNAVCPGPTETAMTAALATMHDVHEGLRRAIPLQRWAQPEEVAAVIAFLVSSAASFVNGAIIPVDGGITANTGQFTPGDDRPRRSTT